MQDFAYWMHLVGSRVTLMWGVLGCIEVASQDRLVHGRLIRGMLDRFDIYRPRHIGPGYLDDSGNRHGCPRDVEVARSSRACRDR